MTTQGKIFLMALLLVGGLLAFYELGDGARIAPGQPEAAAKASQAAGERKGANKLAKIEKSDAEWKKELTPEQFQVMRQKGTERAFTGAYWNTHDEGKYLCAACGLELFDSDTKFDSGTGWPSFWQPVEASHVATESNWGFGMKRTEALCARCGAHLGHVFDDGPKPTGLRYCMNSVSLKFVPEKAEK